MFLNLHLRIMINIECRLSQYFSIYGDFTSAQGRCQSNNLYGLDISLAYPYGEEGGPFNCSYDLYLPSRRPEEEGVRCSVESAPCALHPITFKYTLFKFTDAVVLIKDDTLFTIMCSVYFKAFFISLYSLFLIFYESIAFRFFENISLSSHPFHSQLKST